MPRKLNWNPKSAHAELSAADAAVDPLLEAAKITSLKVSGKDTPASEAPLEDKIRAYASVSQPGATTHDMSDLVTTNDQLASENTRLEGENTRLKAGTAALTQEKSQLTSDLATAKSGISTLTAGNAELLVRHDAALRQVGDWTSKFQAVNSELSRRCLAVGCLVDLRDKENELLPSTANAEAKQSAAEKITAAEKLAALCGAVNSALAKTSVDIAQLPTANPTTNGAPAKNKEPELTGLARTRAAFKKQLSGSN